MPPLVAGVDSSTQSTKVLVCDAASGRIVREGRAPHPDATEVDPQIWWDAYLEATGDGLLDGVSAIAVAGQQHGMVVLDEEHEVVRPALLWNDTRSAQAANDLVDELGGPAAWADAPLPAGPVRDRREALFSELLFLGSQAWLTGTEAEPFYPLKSKAKFLEIRDGTISVLTGSVL